MTSATIATELGDIEVDLFDESAPKASANFIKLANEGLLRRRRLPSGHPGLRRPGRRRPVRQEGVPRARPRRDRRSGLQVRGRAGRRATTSAARWRWPTPGPNTNGSQFFICHQDLTGKLPKNYTLFGQVTRGMDVVDKIVGAPRDGRDLPDEPVAMTSVTIHPSGRLRNLHPRACQNPWKTAPDGVGYGCCSVSAAPAARSWVGRVRVVGAADVIDALDAWQKRPPRRTPSPGQLRGRFLREPASAFVRHVTPGVRVRRPVTAAALHAT